LKEIISTAAATLVVVFVVMSAIKLVNFMSQKSQASFLWNFSREFA
jgi:hypothetical protein